MRNNSDIHIDKASTQTTVLRIPKSKRLEFANRKTAPSPPPEPSLAPDLPTPVVLSVAAEQNDKHPLYKEFLEGIYDGVLVTNLEGWIIDSNQRATEFFQNSPDALKGCHITDLLSGASTDLLEKLLDDLNNDIRLVLQAHCIRQDKSTFPAEITLNLIHLSEEGEICFLVRNISRRVTAEDDLKASEARFRDISESMSDWIWEIDMKGHYTYCSERASSILGHPIRKMLGRPFYFFSSQEHRREAERQVTTILRERKPFRELEVWLHTEENDWCCISFSGCPIRNDKQGIIGFRGVASDITEQKVNDAELQRHRHHLEDLVVQRTAELIEANNKLKREVSDRKKAEANVRLANQELKRSNDELQQFGYVVSHDLKEPLRMIAGYSQLVARRYSDQLPEEAQEFISYSVDGAIKMQSMIDDLLAYTQLSNDGRNGEKCNLTRIIKQTLSNLKVSIDESNATFQLGDLPMVKGDYTQLILLFQNLISNAIKFRQPDKAPHITIDAEPAENSMAAFIVNDNGIGIPGDQEERVFMIFQRLDTQDGVAGTGIGLSICRKIVENHGGRISLQPAPTDTRGTSFTFTLPYWQEDTGQTLNDV